VNLHRNWSPPYFYFRSNWPTDLESASHVSSLQMKVFTTFKVDTTIRCYSYNVIAADTLRDLVTLTFDLLTLISGHTWRVNPQLWVLTSPIGYHCQCVCRHCACAVSRDLCVRGKFFLHIWNTWPWFAYSLYNFYGATIRTFNVKAVFRPIIIIVSKYLRNRAQNGGFRGKWGVDVKFWFCNP